MGPRFRIPTGIPTRDPSPGKNHTQVIKCHPYNNRRWNKIAKKSKCNVNYFCLWLWLTDWLIDMTGVNVEWTEAPKNNGLNDHDSKHYQSIDVCKKKKLLNFIKNQMHWWTLFWVMRAGFGNSQRHPVPPFHLWPTTIPGPQDATVGPKHNLPPNWNHKGTNFHVTRAYKCPLLESARRGVFCCHPAQSVLMCAQVNKPAGAHSIDLGQFRTRRKMERFRGKETEVAISRVSVGDLLGLTPLPALR